MESRSWFCLSHFRGVLAVILLITALLGSFCHTAKKSPRKPDVPVKPGKKDPPNQGGKVDTIRFDPAKNVPPPIKDGDDNGTKEGEGDFSEKQFRIAMMLPFLGKQFDTMPEGLPEKSRLALQFYAGAKLALETLSNEEGMNLIVDVFDTNISDSDFERLLNQSKTEKADVYIGPIRSSHVEILAKKAKPFKKIIVSPESPNPNLTSGNPYFLQLTPSLKNHCKAISNFIKSHYPDAEPVVVCKQKESERVGFFKFKSGAPKSLLMPDNTANFDKTDLKSYIKPGKTTVFIMPSWSSQDFVAAFLRKLKTDKGKEKVIVMGMPQWIGFENIEPDFFSALQVHISSDSYINRKDEAFRAFQQKFYDLYGTIPDEDGIKGYDCMLYVGNMLKKYSLDFPQKVWSAAPFIGFHGQYSMAKIAADSPEGNDRFDKYDYLENSFVHILKFENFGFVPAN